MMRTMPSLTAVILADNFSPNFGQFGTENCWGLQKLCNSTHLERCLLWIARTCVNRVIVVVGNSDPEAHKEIRKLLSAFDGFFSGTLIFDKSIDSVGEAIRVVDRENLISGEFMLVHNPLTICSSSLEREIEEFFELRKEDKNNTLVLLHMKTRMNDNIPLEIEKETGKLLSFDDDGEEVERDSAYEGSDDDESTIHRNLIDTGIAFCAQNIASEFTGNFDFQQRVEVIEHLLENEDVLAQNIHIHVLPEEVAAFTANGLADIIEMQRLLLQRWFSPVIASRLSMIEQPAAHKIATYRDNIYHKSTRPSRPVSSQKFANMLNVYFAENVTFGDSVTLENVSIGEGSKIGNNVSLKNCVIGDGVIISDNSIINDFCFVCDNVSIGENCTIGADCFIAKNYTVPDNSVIADKSVLSNQPHYALPSSSSSEGQDSGEDCAEDNEDFFSDIQEAMKEAYDEQDSSERNSKNLLIEINRSRLIYNLSILEVARHVIDAFLRLDFCDNLKVMEHLIDKWEDVFENFYGSPEGQMTLLNELVKYAQNHPSFTKKLKHVISYFYNNDVLEDEAILEWFTDVRMDTAIHAEMTQLVNALKAQA